MSRIHRSVARCGAALSIVVAMSTAMVLSNTDGADHSADPGPWITADPND